MYDYSNQQSFNQYDLSDSHAKSNMNVVQQPFIDPNDQYLYDASPRGEDHTPMVAYLSGSLLRIGLSLKTLSIALMCIFFVGFGGKWIFTYQSHPNLPSNFHLTMVLCLLLYMVGTLCLVFFQAFVADDSKWTTGFRTGSKILSAAVTLDMLCTMLRLIQYMYLYNYLSVAWWTRYNISKSAWTLFSVQNFLDGLSYISYGVAFFYMEMYHDEGTNEQYGWYMLSFYLLSGIMGIVMIFSNYGAVLVLISSAVALFIATNWSFAFEPLLSKWSPQLHSRCVNAEILPSDTISHEKAMHTTTKTVTQQDNMQSSMQGSYNNGGMISQADQCYSQNNAIYNQYSDLPTSYDYSQLQQACPENLQQPYGIVQS